MINSFHFFFFCIACFLLIACNQVSDEQAGKVLAQVYDQKLFENDIRQLEFSNLSTEDSIFLVEAYVDNWVRTQLKMQIAEDRVKDLDAIESMVKDYRTSLLIHRLEEDHLRENLDTFISAEDLFIWYEDLKNDFILTTSLLKGRLIICPADSVSTDSLSLWLTDTGYTKEGLAEKLNRYLCEFALFQEEWHDVSVIAGWFNKPATDILRFATDQRVFTEKTNDELRGIFVSGIVKAGNPAPVEHIENRLTTRILKERRRKILNELHEKLYVDALSRNQIKFYTR